MKKPVRLDKLVSNLGYGSRREVDYLAKAGRLTDRAGNRFAKGSVKVTVGDVLLDGERIDSTELFLILHKPAGYTCSHRDHPPLIYEILPDRFSVREPSLSSVGRLDKDTTGALLLTDHGQLLHRLTSPQWKLPKVYVIETRDPVDDKQIARLSEGGWCLPGDNKPLYPTVCKRLAERTLEMTMIEGRFHQIKRMLEAMDNPVTALHRNTFAGLGVEDLPVGEWRHLNLEELKMLFGQCGLELEEWQTPHEGS